MRLCFFSSNLWPYTHGGVERRYYEFARSLMELGHEVYYVTYDWGPSEISILSVGKPPKSLYDRKGRRRLATEILYGVKSAWIARRANCDVYDASMPYTEAPFLPRNKTVLTLHEFWGSGWREYFGRLIGGIVEKLEREIIKSVAAVIVPTELVKRRLEGVRSDVYVVPFGLRVEEYLHFRSRDKKFDVAFIGRMVPYKGWDLLIEVLKKIDKPLRVLAVGDGPLYGKIRAEFSKINHHVTLMTRVDEEEKKKLLGASRIYLNLSRREGFSITTLEAIALGAFPVVYNNTGENAAAEVVNTLGYGAVVSRVEDVVKYLSCNCVNSQPPSSLDIFDIRNVVRKYEKIITSL
ncbi:MAG: glycosyltransferase family 4 protein [Pyrobaculum sp.]